VHPSLVALTYDSSTSGAFFHLAHSSVLPQETAVLFTVRASLQRINSNLWPSPACCHARGVFSFFFARAARILWLYRLGQAEIRWAGPCNRNLNSLSMNRLLPGSTPPAKTSRQRTGCSAIWPRRAVMRNFGAQFMVSLNIEMPLDCIMTKVSRQDPTVSHRQSLPRRTGKVCSKTRSHKHGRDRLESTTRSTAVKPVRATRKGSST
jgi:hypothetical protein